jgi:hypothetical protein
MARPTPSTRPLRFDGRQPLRYPCGHTDTEASIARRLRIRPQALWVACPRCNVVALVTARIEKS